MSDTTILNATQWRSRKLEQALRNVNVARRRVNMLHAGGDPTQLECAQRTLQCASDRLRALRGY